MILIYISKLSARKDYIFKHIFKRLLDQPYDLTTDIQKFVSHDGAKMSYGMKPLGNEIFVWSHGLLDEQGIESHDVHTCKWNGLPAIFPAPKSSSIPFDIFSACFYLITRYEEYLPQVKDEHGRYDATESIAAKASFLQLPIVDLWCRDLLGEILRRYDLKPQKVGKPQIAAAVEVKSLRKYRGRGFAANLSLALEAIKNFKWATLLRQIYALTGLIPDPYKNEERLIKIFNENSTSRESKLGSKRLIFFINVSDKHRNNFIRNRQFIELAKYIADYLRVGIRYSQRSDEESIKKETKLFESHFNQPLNKVIIARSSIDMPNFYKHLVDVDRIEDYSMGYDTMPGFRAGTCKPFYFYDLDYEIQTPLVVNPYALHYKSIAGRTLSGQNQIIQQMLDRVREVQGNFVVMFNYGQFDNGKSTHVTAILEKILSCEL